MKIGHPMGVCYPVLHLYTVTTQQTFENSGNLDSGFGEKKGHSAAESGGYLVYLSARYSICYMKSL